MADSWTSLTMSDRHALLAEATFRAGGVQRGIGGEWLVYGHSMTPRVVPAEVGEAFIAEGLLVQDGTPHFYRGGTEARAELRRIAAARHEEREG